MSKNKKKNTGRTVRIVLLALVLIGVVLVAALYFGLKNYNKPLDPESKEMITFEVKPGNGTTTIALNLQDAGIIKYSQIFKYKSKLVGLDGKYQAGTYLLSPSMTMDELMAALQVGRSPEVDFTIPEGLTLNQVAEKLLEQKMIADVQDFYKALEDDYNYDFLPVTGNAVNGISALGNRIEGYLYPETYRVFVGATPHMIIDTMLSQFEKVAKDELEGKLPNGYTLQEIVTLASIIEEECGADSDRNRIAGVFWNRLRDKMKLQSDVTIIYALGDEKFSTQFNSPYNTYLVPGLPAGPICSPSIKSIKAALNPESHNYYYFVLIGDGSGRCNFASTFEEHLVNVDIWKNNPFDY